MQINYDAIKSVFSDIHCATGTHWTDHKIKAMKGMLEKYGVYMKHTEMVFADEQKKNTDIATLHEKRGKLLEATTFFCAAFFLDILEPAKMFSLMS